MQQLKPCSPVAASRRLPLLLVTEGIGDIKFLNRISRTLHVADDRLPDLGLLERLGELIFIPIGGGKIAAGGERLSRPPIGGSSSTIVKWALKRPVDERRPPP
jgi:hypothetical protein